jgi:hypothetical protein
LPLHAFCPTQLLLADPQDPWPLQALAPIQRPLPSSACDAGARARPVSISVAAAAAMEVPDRETRLIFKIPFRLTLNFILAQGTNGRLSTSYSRHIQDEPFPNSKRQIGLVVLVYGLPARLVSRRKSCERFGVSLCVRTGKPLLVGEGAPKLAWGHAGDFSEFTAVWLAKPS